MKSKQPVATNIIFDIFGVLFHWDPLQNHLAGVSPFTPIHENIELIYECAHLADHHGKPLHRLFLLSNCKLDLLEQLYKEFPDVFEPFEGIVIPSNSGFAKPDKRMFEHLLVLHDLQPSNSIFVDDAPENTKTAIQLGITGITYRLGVNLKQAFITHGLIPYTHV